MRKLLKIIGLIKEVRIEVPISKNELVLALQQVTHHADTSLPKYMDEHLPAEKKFVGSIDGSGFTIRPKNLDKFRTRANVDLITGRYIEQNGDLFLYVRYNIIASLPNKIHYLFSFITITGFVGFVAYSIGIVFVIFSPIFLGFMIFAYYLLVVYPMSVLKSTFENELLTVLRSIRKADLA